MKRLASALGLSAALAAQAVPLRNQLLDDFRDVSAWKASASDQVRASLRRDGDGSLCLDYDFAGVSGYAVMRRELPVRWPAHFDLALRLKSSGAVNDFQFKLVDAGGDNVWWVNRPNATGQTLPRRLGDVTLRRRHIEFAWGPAADRSLRRTQFVEWVVAAGREGGKGSLCVARLALNEREPEPAAWPEPQHRLHAGALHLDLGARREFNGLALRWPGTARRLDYDVAASDDGRTWRTLRRVRGSDGGLDALFLPESEARHLRIGVPRGAPAPAVELRSAAQWPQLNAVLSSLAADAPRGDLPRAFVGQQNYWTLVGVDGGGDRSGLLSEDGALEIGRGGFSIEPSVQLTDGRRITWADVRLHHSLPEGHLPLPRVHWSHQAFDLEVQAAADGPAETPQLLARYRLRNTGSRPQTYTLMLALRPWQVNPPQQFLNTPGGASPVRGLRWDGRTLQVPGRTALRFSQPPRSVTALPLDGGLSLQALGRAARLVTLRDPQGMASAALQFRVTLAPGASHALGFTAPLAGAGSAAAQGAGTLRARFDAAAGAWRERLNRVALRLPADAQPIADRLRSALAQMLMSRRGPALQPGTRAYARSWVRDGAMMVAGLLPLGEVAAAREFTDWYAGHIFDSGKVPCCVDARGADPVVENDSHGQYLYAVAEVWRHTADAAFVQRHWPHVQRVLAWMEGLRQSERSAANRAPGRVHLFGLMPPSISHEGYSDKPAYAYWDAFWALRGYTDAVLLARAVGAAELAQQWSAWRDEFQQELQASILASAAHHGIGFIAGAADRGDFDATSTTVALHPAQAEPPPALLQATFERYWQESDARRRGQRTWRDYTPYELRSVGAFTRLGQPERAHAMLDFFFKDQRPQGWNQWAEVVLPDPREPRFLGDMPHAWVASDYIRSALDLFALHREAEGSLVIGAGLRPQWLLDAGGVQVQGLSTPFGPLHYELRPAGAHWLLDVPRALPGLQRWPGQLVLRWPDGLPLPRARHEGQDLPWVGRELRLPAPPLRLLLASE